MSLMAEYINRKLSIPDLEKELSQLVSQYNTLEKTYLFVYAAATEKPVPFTHLMEEDFYIFRDLLSGKKHSNCVDVYLETRGGSGETAEEIVRFLHNNFETVSFVISGEAKSAGTIIALSGNEILMTETGSLGPIDAQMRIGRSIVSAADYIDWVQEKREVAAKHGALNPFDATMIAQITPGELSGALHALEFAKDRVVEWLPKYKFKEWNTTETQKTPVTPAMKEKRAREIAKELTNRTRWRSHGRSIKIQDLEDIGLKIIRIDDNPEQAEIVYRIQTVCRLLFNSSIFKIFATQDDKIFRLATQMDRPVPIPVKNQPDVVEFEQKCTNCGTVHKLYAKLVDNPKIDTELKNKGLTPFPENAKIKCSCGAEIDLLGIKNEIELKIGRKVITGSN